jgi:hypothetical protein
MKPVHQRIRVASAVAAAMALSTVGFASAQTVSQHDHSQLKMDEKREGHDQHVDHARPAQTALKKKSAAKPKKPASTAETKGVMSCNLGIGSKNSLPHTIARTFRVR